MNPPKNDAKNKELVNWSLADGKSDIFLDSIDVDPNLIKANLNAPVDDLKYTLMGYALELSLRDYRCTHFIFFIPLSQYPQHFMTKM